MITKQCQNQNINNKLIQLIIVIVCLTAYIYISDRDIIDVCGGILKEGQEVMKVPGQRNHSIANRKGKCQVINNLPLLI